MGSTTDENKSQPIVISVKLRVYVSLDTFYIRWT